MMETPTQLRIPGIRQRQRRNGRKKGVGVDNRRIWAPNEAVSGNLVYDLAMMTQDPQEFYDALLDSETPSQRDLAAFAEILWTHFSEPIYALAMRKLRKADLAEDVTQETITLAVDWVRRKAGAQPTRNHLKAWVMRIAHNASIDVIRGIYKHKALNLAHGAGGDESESRKLEDVLPDHAAPSPDAGLMEAEQLAALKACLELLTESDRKIVTMRYLQGAANKDIAAAVNTSPNNIAVRLFRSRDQLRDCIESKVGGNA